MIFFVFNDTWMVLLKRVMIYGSCTRCILVRIYVFRITPVRCAYISSLAFYHTTLITRAEKHVPNSRAFAVKKLPESRETLVRSLTTTTICFKFVIPTVFFNVRV